MKVERKNAGTMRGKKNLQLPSKESRNKLNSLNINTDTSKNNLQG